MAQHKKLVYLPVTFGFLTTKGSWRARQSPGGSECLMEWWLSAGPNTTPSDPWTLRDRFLRLHRDEAELLEFLNMAGAWAPSGGAFFLINGLPPIPADSRPVSEFWEWQDICRLLMTDPLTFWRDAYPHLEQEKQKALDDFTVRLKITAENKQFQAISRVWGTLPLILLSIHIDLLNRARFRQCARPDCFGIFQIETRHRRIYCGQYCGHLESVRRNRRIKKKGSTGGSAQR